MPKKARITLPKGTKVPNHIVVIPDGNRRWARARGLPDYKGHQEGARALINILEATRDLGIHTSTFWGLSTENWRERSEKEVEILMKTMASGIDQYLSKAKKQGVRVIHLGRKDRLPSFLMKRIEEIEKETAKNDKHIFNIALDYGGQDEIIRATQKLIADSVKPTEINEKLMDKYMDTAGQPYPYPDLIIRTSGEQRTSGVLLWQSHYAETYWEPDHFPDFTPAKLRAAIVDYSRRRRRFGGNDVVGHMNFRPEVTANLELAWWRLRHIPEGTRFRDYAIKHLREQYGLSKTLAKEGAKHMAKALIYGKEKEWEKAKTPLKAFYKLIKSELKLAFEPALAASLEVKLWKEMRNKESIEATGEAEETTREFYAEVYRISLFQAAKVAHLRVMANVERNLAEKGLGEHHWDRAEDYLEKFYAALKERVA